MAAMAAMAASGCHKSGEQRLEGHWRGTNVEGVSPDAQAAATAFALDTELDFHDGKVLVTTPRDKISSAFKVTRDDKGTVVVATELDGAKDPQTFAFADDNTMRWPVTEGVRITFRRVSR